MDLRYVVTLIAHRILHDGNQSAPSTRYTDAYPNWDDRNWSLPIAEGNLDLLGTPALVSLAHVGGRLDGGDELEGDVSETDEADQRAVDDAQHVVV